MTRTTDLVVRGAAITMAAFHLYTAYAGTFYPYIQRSVPLLLSLVIVFLTIRSSRSISRDNGVPFYDWILVALSIPVVGYVTVASDHLTERWPLTPSFPMSPFEIIFALLAILLILEATRRVLGWLLVGVAAVALSYGMLGEHVPVLALRHRGFTVEQLLDYLYMTDNGVWGVALGVAATYVVLFVIFSAFAERAGLAEFFIRFATSLTGHTRGGPAKVAIVSSAMIGSVTGSTVANVYTTGQFTIPLMKRLGYQPRVAGAVEALASNGGQIMPPILGAAAFLIAAYSGVSYAKIAMASLIPALLYFGGLIWFVHLEAHKTGLVGIPRDEKPRVLDELLKGGHLFSPLIVLIGCLVYGYSPMRSAFFAILFTVVISWVRKETRLGPKEILLAMEMGAKNAVLIVVACAVLGFVIGTFTLTGLGLNLSSAIIAFSYGSFFLCMVLVGLSCIILGMGMNTISAFILVSVIGVPALAEYGVDDLVANMFVFYFALLSHITPPVCLAVFAGAQIAGANMWETAWSAVKMSSAAYLLPFLIVLMPTLLLIGTPLEIALDTAVAVVGLSLIITGIQGWALQPIGWPERLSFIGAGVCFIWPDDTMRSLAVVLAVGLGIIVILRARRHEPNPAG